MAGEGPAYDVGAGGTAISGGRVRTSTPTYTARKTVTFGAVSNNIYSATSTVSATAQSGALPSRVRVVNDGSAPLSILIGYETWSTELLESSATRYLHVQLMPGESFNPPVRALISTHADPTQFDGSALDNEVPNAAKYRDSDANLAAHVDAPDTSISVDDGNCFRVNDLIQLGDDSGTSTKVEIMQVTSITDTAADGAFTPAALAVRRGVHGSNINDKDVQTDGTDGSVVGANVYLPFFNAYHDYDKYSVAQLDDRGNFIAKNFFGFGRAISGVQGVVPGSVAIKFYNSGYQELGLSGISPSTNSGLTAGETLKLDITVDGGTLFQDLTFTLDSSNVNFGGVNGVLSKIQSALDTQYYTAGNLFEKRVSVGIVNGDVRFTSGSRLSTSAILLADTGDSDTFIDAAANGRIPASDKIDGAVAARLPDDVIYDPITYATTSSNVFCTDNGMGRLSGLCNGSINYETGAIALRNGPPNAEFVVSASYKSAWSGKLNTGTNALVEILANCQSPKKDGSVYLEIF